MPVISPLADWFSPDLPTTTAAAATTTDYAAFVLRHTWNGLALFAVFVIARHAVRKVSARWRRVDGATNTDAPFANGTDDHWQHPPFGDNITHCKGRQGTIAPRRSSEPYQSQHCHLPSAPLPWMMTGHSGAAEGLPQQGQQAPAIGEQARSAPAHPEGAGRGGAPLPPYIMARRPPAAPLTPPPPTQVFTPEHGALGATLIHQPNPDYLSTDPTPATSSDPAPPQTQGSPLTIPAHSRSSSSGAGPSPHSFPSPTPFLPPAMEDAGKGVDVKGEVVSVTDGFGTGWTRHTRVYGGGVCLACAASGEGFYGATALRPEGS